MYYILIKLTEDIPERGRQWTKDRTFEVAKELAEKLIREKKAKLFATHSPVKTIPPPQQRHEEEE